MKKKSLNEEVTRIQEMMGVKHISPSGKETNMSPDDDDYEINYGKNAIEEISPSDIVGSMREEEADENTEVLNKFKDQYGDKKGEEVYYATANKQDRDPETFEKNEAFDPSDSDDDGLSDCCGAPIVMHDICSECGEHCEAEEEIDENISKSTAILNRPSNRMTFEQMGMIMVLADELGGEENAKANEFVSGVVTKMKADEYIKELIAKIDNEQETPKDMPGFEGTTDALDDLGIREGVDEESAIGGWDLAMEDAMVGSDNRVDYLENALGGVWNMGRGNNKIDLKSMAQSLIDDLFGNDDTETSKDIPGFEDTTDALDDLGIREEVESFMKMRAGKDGKVYEGRPGFKQENFYNTQSEALQSAEEYAKHKGFDVNWESITPQHVAYEKTVQYHVEILKDGKPLKKMLQISLYRMPSGKYELTNYIM
jgi:hypothetical protein